MKQQEWDRRVASGQPVDCPRPPYLLVTTGDVHLGVSEATSECAINYFSGRRLDVDEFFDRLVEEYSGDRWDIEDTNNAAARKILRIAREAIRESNF